MSPDVVFVVLGRRGCETSRICQPFYDADVTIETLRGALAFEDRKVGEVEDGARRWGHVYLIVT